MYLIYEVKKHSRVIILLICLSLFFVLIATMLSSFLNIKSDIIFKSIIFEQYRLSRLFWVCLFILPLSIIAFYWYSECNDRFILELYRYPSFRKWIISKVSFIFFLHFLTFIIYIIFLIGSSNKPLYELTFIALIITFYSMFLSILLICISFFIKSIATIFYILTTFHIINILFFKPGENITLIYFVMTDYSGFIGIILFPIIISFLLILLINLKQENLILNRGEY